MQIEKAKHIIPVTVAIDPKSTSPSADTNDDFWLSESSSVASSTHDNTEAADKSAVAAAAESTTQVSMVEIFQWLRQGYSAILRVSSVSVHRATDPHLTIAFAPLYLRLDCHS